MEITNEEAIAIIEKEFSEYKDTLSVYAEKRKKAFDMAIKALEQESILDKIRAEIKALSNANPSYWHSGDMVEREDVLDIIDKYIEGSESE